MLEFVFGVLLGGLLMYLWKNDAEPILDEDYEKELQKLRTEKAKVEAELAAFKLKFDATIKKLTGKL